MKIAFFTDTFFPAHNGIISSIVNYANGLVAEGHEVLICAPYHPQAQQVDWGLDKKVKVLLAPSIAVSLYPDARFMLPTGSLMKRLKNFQPDILHNHYIGPSAIAALLYSKRHGIPVVATCNTQFFLKDIKKFLKAKESWFTNALHFLFIRYIIFLYKRHKLVLSLSANIQKVLQSYGISSPIVPISIPEQWVTQGKKPGLKLKKEQNIHQSLIFVGRVSEEKNIDHSLYIFAELVKKIPKLQFVIVGGGPDEPRIKKLVADLDLTDKVIFWGIVPYSEIFEQGLFYLGDVFITMSECEAQGLSTIEAMASGLPVIAAHDEVNIEVVGEGGIIVSYDNWQQFLPEIEKLFTNSTVYNSFSKRALRSASRYSTTRCVQKLVDHYRTLLVT